MKYAYWGFGMVMAGLIGIVFLVMFQSITINNETEYYVLKEAMEASMLEAVDLTCYRYKNKDNTCGEVVKISEQKFVENFTRRFVENMSGDVTKYTLEFYDILETPPKASVLVTGTTQSFTIITDSEEGFDIKNALSGILEYDEVKTSEDTNIIEPNKKLEISIPNSSGGNIETATGTNREETKIEDEGTEEVNYTDDDLTNVVKDACCNNGYTKECCYTVLSQGFAGQDRIDNMCNNYINESICGISQEEPQPEEKEEEKENEDE